jgi:D-3-phosphoglycerate dehydrogenase
VRIYSLIDSKDIYYKFFETFTETQNITGADIILCGVNTINVSGYKAKYVVCPCTNTNHVRIGPHQQIISLEGMDLSTVRSTAEHTLYLMMAIAKGRPLTPGSEFKRPERPYTLLSGKKLGIIGYGRIGKQVKEMAEALNMYVWTCDIKDPDFLDNAIAICREADFISIHASIEKRQKPILGRTELSLIKDGAYIINTSRGEAIDEKALLDHLPRLGGFATDVLVRNGASERFDTLVAMPNVVITPHVAGYTTGDMEKTSAYCHGKLIEKLSI